MAVFVVDHQMPGTILATIASCLCAWWYLDDEEGGVGSSARTLIAEGIAPLMTTVAVVTTCPDSSDTISTIAWIILAATLAVDMIMKRVSHREEVAAA